MTVAARKKQEHIVDHVLYCWQMEDLVRASQFSPRSSNRGRSNMPWLRARIRRPRSIGS